MMGETGAAHLLGNECRGNVMFCDLLHARVFSSLGGSEGCLLIGADIADMGFSHRPVKLLEESGPRRAHHQLDRDECAACAREPSKLGTEN